MTKTILLLAGLTAVLMTGCNKDAEKADAKADAKAEVKADANAATAAAAHKDQFHKRVDDLTKDIVATAAAGRRADEPHQVAVMRRAGDLAIESSDNAHAPPKFMDALVEHSAQQVAWAMKVQTPTTGPTTGPAGGPARPALPPVPPLITPGMIEDLHLPDGPGAPGPSSGGAGKGPSDDQKKAMQAIMTMMGAALCVYQPEICPLVMALAQMMGSSEQLSQNIETMRQVSEATQTGQWDPALVDRLAKQIKDQSKDKIPPGLIDGLAQLPRAADAPDPVTTILRQAAEQSGIKERLLKDLPGWGKELVEAIENGKTPEEVLSLVHSEDKVPLFEDAEQMKRVHAAVSVVAGIVAAKYPDRGDVMAKYWDQLLAKVKVKEAKGNP